jgi:DHA1 family tetracycline resistance protein-like MFS transporter
LSANAATQLVGTPIIGRLSDRYGLAFTVFQTVFALFAQIRLALDAQATGYVFSYVGLRIVAIQGDGIGLLEKSY